MKDKKRLIINISAQIFASVIGFIINFFLTPFVIEKLGTEAYGFIGLANNFVSYTTLITIALNSMAARFIAVSFHKGDIETAKKYFSSVYYSNLFLSILIAIFAVFIIIFLNYLVKIPIELEWDVKLLFGLTFFNSLIALISNIYMVATFVKNRIDLSSLRSIISNLLKVIFMIIPFLLFKPHLWYYGISALIATMFIAFSNRFLTKKLLPDFTINKSMFDFKLVKTLFFSGGWNLLSKLSDILSTGLDLLLTNLFIGTMAMGVLSISKSVQVIILSLFGSIAAVFAPKLTEFYAQEKIEILRNELINNIRIMGILSALPIIVFIVLGKDFFQLWVPTEDAHVLYILSSLAIVNLLIALPIESLWNIFTITNKVKISSLNLLFFSVLILATILIGVSRFDNAYNQLLTIVIARLFWGGLRSITFLPIYGAKCLGLKWYVFYPIIFKNLIVSIILIIVFLLLKNYFTVIGWFDFTLSAGIICTITIVLMFLIMLNKNQKVKVIKLLREKITTK
ncbi:hypothetical protein FACS189451_03190 [Bacteroidia bacterium]|nr:hypothetical protein FACS189451_03190 [Bacteroidia bacterium]